MKEEIWKSIEGYPNYEVSNLGNVRSLNYRNTNNNKLLKQLDKNSYKKVFLWKNGERKCFYVHRLVAQAFILNPDNLPQINHIDEDKTNNCVENLEWCTQKYNINYGTHNERLKQHHGKPMLGKTGKKNPNSKPIDQYTKDGDFIKSWDSTMDVQRELGINNSSISACARGNIKSAGGYIWRYKEDKAV